MTPRATESLESRPPAPHDPPMDMIESLPLLTRGDWAGLSVLTAVWWGATWIVEHPPGRRPSVTTLMDRHRHAWMRQMLTRDGRNFDAAIVGNLRQGTAFFASGSLFALGGVLALAGNSDRVAMLIENVPVASGSAGAWQVKLVVSALLLTHAFLSFVWSNRLFGYCAVIMAATPEDHTDPNAPRCATQAARLNIRAAHVLNRGLRSIYLALVTLAWLLGWEALLVALAGFALIIGWREFSPGAREVLTDG